jgi:hypothetical protein
MAVVVVTAMAVVEAVMAVVVAMSMGVMTATIAVENSGGGG